MDEPAQNEDIHLDGDQTQPTGEIIAALNQNGSSNSIKTEADLDSPTSEFDALFARLSENPHDPEGWKRLIELATNSGEIPKIQKAYDEVLKYYPNTVSGTREFRWTQRVFMEFDPSRLHKLRISAIS
jgi:cleavage stimulation factor subunit 3